ncbi:MAG: hypothetical protein ACTTIM_05980 [Campylobacter sp.]
MNLKVLISALIALNLQAGKIEQKAQEETFLLLNALTGARASEQCEIYKKLYSDTQKSEYLLEAVRGCYSAKDSYLADLMKLGDEKLSQDMAFAQIKVAYLVDGGKIAEATQLAENLAKMDKNERNYLILGAIYLHIGKFENALQNYKEAYALNAKNIDTLLRLSEILINRLSRENEALELLENDRKTQGCNSVNCEILIDIYKNRREYSQIPKLLYELYDATKDEKYLNHLWQLYYFEKKYSDAIEVLEKYHLDNHVLFHLYSLKGDKKSALKLADENYIKTKNKEYLAISAMFDYELNSPNIKDEALKRVIDKFEKSVYDIKFAEHFNYYGYLLISHNLDVKKGINLVKRALEMEPNSSNTPYFIDSLAWGYYKLGECKKAGELFNTIDKKSKFFNELEAKEHISAINLCIKNSKNGGENLITIDENQTQISNKGAK